MFTTLIGCEKALVQDPESITYTIMPPSVPYTLPCPPEKPLIRRWQDVWKAPGPAAVTGAARTPTTAFCKGDLMPSMESSLRRLHFCKSWPQVPTVRL